MNTVPTKIVDAIPDDPNARHHHPNIGGSKAGAYNVSFRATSQKFKLLVAYATMGDCTADEAFGATDIRSGSAYWMRCSELRASGLIEAVTDPITGNVVMRDGDMGSPQMVCRITPAGLSAIGR